MQNEIGSSFKFEAIEVIPLQFDEAINYLKNKTDIPTASWKDIVNEANITGFAAAGAADKDLLKNLHDAVNSAIKDGTTISEFRKQFDNIVATYGWTYYGDRNWRTRVIFDTNMHSARSFGRYEQQIRVKEDRRWLRYITAGDNRVRPNHRVLSGVVRSIESGFWDYYYPPNGFRCRCTAVSYDDDQLEKFGYKETKFSKFTKKEMEWTDENGIKNSLGSKQVINQATGKKEYLRDGITNGFQYSQKDYIENLLAVSERPKTL